MRRSLTAPVSCFLATALTVFNLSLVTKISDNTRIPDEPVLGILLTNSGALAAQASLQLILSSTVIWMIIFSAAWLLLSFLSRDPVAKES